MTYRLHDFTTGDTIDLRQVNEEAVHLHKKARELLAKRWCHFSFLMPVGAFSSATSAYKTQFKVEAPFKWDIIEIEVYATDAASSAAQVITCATTGPDETVRDVSVTIESDTSATIPYYSDIVKTVAHVPASTVVTFQFSSDNATAHDDCWALVHGRYDRYDGITLSDPPQVRAGETISPTEWNTWFSDMATDLTAMQVAAPKRKHIQLVQTRLADTATSGTKYVIFPGKGDYNGGTTAGKLLGAAVYIAGSNGMIETVAALDYETGVSGSTFSQAATADGATLVKQAVGTLTDDEFHSDSTDPADMADRWEIQSTASGSAGTKDRCYTVLYWET